MSSFKDFDAAIAEHAAAATGEPVTFKLGGIMFTLANPIPIAPILELASIINIDDQDEAAMLGALNDLKRFLCSLVIAEQSAQLLVALVESRVGLDGLMEIVSWVAAEALGGPLDEASSSPESPSSTGAPSKVVSLEKGSVTTVPPDSSTAPPGSD